MANKTEDPTRFGLLELIVVVVLLGIVATVATPRVSRGSDGAADASLSADLAVLRRAIDTYADEHRGAYPTAAFVDQITTYTDISGATSPTKTATHIYGPYLRQIPSIPVGAASGNTAVGARSGGIAAWRYDPSTGDIRANTTGAEADSSGTLYSDY
jgi:general secretion pathway protein G